MWLYLNAQISPLDCNGLSFGKKTFMLDMAKWLQNKLDYILVNRK